MTINKYLCTSDCKNYMKCYPDAKKCDVKKEGGNTVINNVNCPSACGQGLSASRPCPTNELVKNGGFEVEGIFEEFADWQQNVSDVRLNFGSPYEGKFSAAISSVGTPGNQEKTVRLFQNITVTPGCLLALSFADNFSKAGTDFEFLQIGASVFYRDSGGNRFNLINIQINYDPNQANNVFVFHQQVAVTPVPCNISSVTVEFFVFIADKGDPQSTEWLLDGVSLRAVSATSVC